MTTLTAPKRTTKRLLAGWQLTHSTDLGAHLSVHGPLPLPLAGPEDHAWRDLHASEIRASGLRGRGGAGFPAWRKFDSVRAARGVPTIVVNAMEGEPASGKDRVLLECAPHLVLDGAQLTATAVGTGRVIVCVAETETRAAESVLRAVGERRAAGIDPVPIQLARPPGGFVAGEESALVSWLDGRRAAPALRVDKSVPLRVSETPLPRPQHRDAGSHRAHLPLRRELVQTTRDTRRSGNDPRDGLGCGGATRGSRSSSRHSPLGDHPGIGPCGHSSRGHHRWLRRHLCRR